MIGLDNKARSEVLDNKNYMIDDTVSDTIVNRDFEQMKTY